MSSPVLEGFDVRQVIVKAARDERVGTYDQLGLAVFEDILADFISDQYPAGELSLLREVDDIGFSIGGLGVTVDLGYSSGIRAQVPLRLFEVDKNRLRSALMEVTSWVYGDDRVPAAESLPGYNYNNLQFTPNGLVGRADNKTLFTIVSGQPRLHGEILKEVLGDVFSFKEESVERDLTIAAGDICDAIFTNSAGRALKGPVKKCLIKGSVQDLLTASFNLYKDLDKSPDVTGDSTVLRAGNIEVGVSLIGSGKVRRMDISVKTDKGWALMLDCPFTQHPGGFEVSAHCKIGPTDGKPMHHFNYNFFI